MWLLAGAGLGTWLTGWTEMRALAVGAPGLPWIDTAALLAAAAAGGWVGCSLATVGRARLLLALLAVLAHALAATVLHRPGLGDLGDPLTLVTTGVAPLALAVATCAGAAGNARAAGRCLAALLLGAASAGAAAATWADGMPIGDLAMAGQIAWIAAAVALGRRRACPIEPETGGAGAAAAGVAVAAAWLCWLPATIAAQPMGSAWARADAAALGAAFVGLFAFGIALGTTPGLARAPRRTAHGAGLTLAVLLPLWSMAVGGIAVAVAGTAVLGVFVAATAVGSRAAMTVALLAAGAAVASLGLPGPSLSAPWSLTLACSVLVLRGRAGWPGLVAAVVAIAVAASLLAWDRPRDDAMHVAVARAATGAVIYDRRHQELQLRADAAVIDTVGPDSVHAELAALLGWLHAPRATGTLVLGQDDGRLARAVRSLDDAPIECIDHRPELQGLRSALLGDGPVTAVGGVTATADVVVRRQPLRSALRRCLPGFVDRILVAEPLGPGDVGTATVEFQERLRVAAGDGICVQTFDLRRVPVALLRSLLQAAAAAHPWTRVFVVGDAGAIVSGGGSGPDRAAAGEQLLAGGDAVRWLAHRLGIGDAADLEYCGLGELVPPVSTVGCRDEDTAGLRRDRGAEPAAARDQLRAALRAPGAVALWALDVQDPRPAVRTRAHQAMPPAPVRRASVLLGRAELRARIAAAEAAVLAAPAADHGSQALAAGLAADLLHVGCPSALLQAALALPDRLGERIRQPGSAVAIAAAVDPGLASAPPVLLAALPWSSAARPVFDSIARLPTAQGLALAAAGPSAAAIAWRIRHPSACARALLTQWCSAADAGEPVVSALRELADPFVLAVAADRLASVGRLADVIAIWRADLPMPARLRELLAGDATARLRLAAALPGRDDCQSLQALADLLVDADGAVRAAAAAALHRTVGNRIPYDPQAPESERHVAAAKVRTLHNRTP